MKMTDSKASKEYVEGRMTPRRGTALRRVFDALVAQGLTGFAVWWSRPTSQTIPSKVGFFARLTAVDAVRLGVIPLVPLGATTDDALTFVKALPRLPETKVEITISRCASGHNVYAIIVGDTRITGSKCCGRWNVFRMYRMDRDELRGLLLKALDVPEPAQPSAQDNNLHN